MIDLVQLLRAHRIVAAIRGDSLVEARAAACAAHAADVAVIDVTYTVPDASTLIGDLASKDWTVGAPSR